MPMKTRLPDPYEPLDQLFGQGDHMQTLLVKRVLWQSKIAT